MRILSFVSLISISVAALSSGRAATVLDKETIGALRVALSHKSFPYEQFSQFTRAQLSKGTSNVVTVVAVRTQVYRLDFDSDGAVDRVLQIDLRARNSQFFVLRRTGSSWTLVGEFVGQEFSFLRFATTVAADLQVTENIGGGNLVVSTYAFREGAYVRQETHREEVR